MVPGNLSFVVYGTGAGRKAWAVNMPENNVEHWVIQSESKSKTEMGMFLIGQSVNQIS
jgi:hypothetical protein